MTAALVVAPLLPIWITAIRTGLAGVQPNSDAALTVLRAATVFTRHPPLTGMPAASARTADGIARFPGAIQLYVLSGPVRILGDVWGPVVAMALLNSIWILLAGWLIVRMFPRPHSVVALAFLSLFCWSIGNTFLIQPVPMEMVLFPFVLFLLAVWASGEGDPVGVVVLAVVANFLWLDHLVLVMVVPVVAMYVPIVWAVRHRRRRRADLRVDPVEARRFRRSVGVALAVGVVMWIPTIVQQVIGSTGNLSLLYRSARQEAVSTGSWPDALHIVVSMIARPPFWLRGSIVAPSYLEKPVGATVAGSLSVFDIVAAVVIVVVVASIAVGLWRRGDRRAVRLLVVAAIAVVVSVPNVYLAPATNWIPSGYFRSLWGAAMVLWMAIAVGVVRLVSSRVAASSAWVASVAVVVVTALSIPTAPRGYGADRLVNSMTSTVNRAVLRDLARRPPTGGMVAVAMPPGFDAQAYAAALMLRIRAEGIAYCDPGAGPDGSPDRPSCPEGPKTTLSVKVLRRASGSPPAAIVAVPSLDEAEQAELDRLDSEIRAALDEASPLEIEPLVRDVLHREPTLRESLRVLETSMADAGDDPGSLLEVPLFVSLVRWYASDSKIRSPLLNVDLPPRESLRRWAELTGVDTVVYVLRHDR